MRLLVTGGAGFIGSNFIRYWLDKHKKDEILNVDLLTYAASKKTVSQMKSPRLRFVKADVCNEKLMKKLARGMDGIVHFAAETHVDRAILDARKFIRTDVYGTYSMLMAAREAKVKKFVQISTDEVYGSITEGSFSENSVLNPRNPYSASKCAADRLAYSFFATHDVPVLITRSSNNFGPYQHPEKFIPLFVTNAIEGKQLPLYGDGQYTRDWIYVFDNCRGIETVLLKGETGEAYNLGGGNELKNEDVATKILDILGMPGSLISHVADRKGHDRRYSIDSAKARKLGWKPKWDFDHALRNTIRWYEENEDWWKPLQRTVKNR